MARSALGIDPADFEVSDPMHAWRIRRAMQGTQKRDTAFFRRHTDRVHRIRKAVPFEQPGWDAEHHLRYPVMLVRLLGDSLHRVSLAGNAEALPNTEEFCKRLYDRISLDLGTEAGETKISPLEHADILEAVGIEVNRG